MKYFLARAVELSRLSDDNYFLLEQKENEIGRCLIPFEIQKIFNLPTIKESFMIPTDNEGVQMFYSRHLFNELAAKGLIPIYGDLSMGDSDEAHNWDYRVREAVIDFSYQGGKKKGRIGDTLELAT